MRALRILHVTPYYRHAWAYGGIPRIVTALTEAQAARGHHVTVWTTDAASTSRWLPPAGTGRWRSWGAPSPSGITVRVFPNLSNRLAYTYQGFLPIGFRRHANRQAHDFDIGHVHACRNLPGVWAATALRRARIPYVVTPNGTAPRLERRLLAKRLFDGVYGHAMLARAARLLAVSEAERQQLCALGIDASRISVVANPIEPAEFCDLPRRGDFRAAFGLGAGPLVVFLGKLTPRKKVDVVIDAFARIPESSALLVIAGNDMGAGADARRRAASQGLDARVRFVGLLCGRDRLAALTDADVVVYPSEHEVFGLVPLEALLCGTPVIVADDCGCAEVVTRVGGGRTVPVADPDALARAAAEVMRLGRCDPQLALARDRILRWFSSAAVAEACDAEYARVLA